MTPRHEPEIIEAKQRAGYWRYTGCSKCGKSFDEYEPFFHHETDMSIGGPFCIDCALEEGLREDPLGHWVFHSGVDKT